MAVVFLYATRLVMLAALPFYFGLAATAEPLILTFLGPKWAETIAIVTILALAMPFLPLQVLFAPATKAPGHTGIPARPEAAGAVILQVPFLTGIRFGMRMGGASGGESGG